MRDKEHYLISKLGSKYIGDDGAVIGSEIYSSDAFCEDVHFRSSWMTPYQVGRKAMLVNLSDAVAMAATPRYALVSVSIPKTYTKYEISQLIKGLEETAREWECEIIGGDTVGGDKLNLSITIISHSTNPLLRDGLEVGDMLAYTGTLGDSMANLHSLEQGLSLADDCRFYNSNLRREFISAARPYLHAGMDISDGLYCDTNKLLDMNDLGYEILNNIDDEMALSGEEYEMLVGFDPIYIDKLMDISRATNTPIHIFARVETNNQRFACYSHHF